MRRCLLLATVLICNVILCAGASDNNYYTLLGIEKDATKQEIKKAYRKMALKWHPDRNADNEEEATKKFKEIAEAYEVLSDDNARQRYDRGGASAFSGGRGGGGGFDFKFKDPGDLFKDFFDGKDPFEEIFGKGGGLFDDLNVNEEEAYPSEALVEVMIKYYREHAPEKEMTEAKVTGILEKYKGRTKTLYRRLKAKYQVAPDELLPKSKPAAGGGFGGFGGMGGMGGMGGINMNDLFKGAGGGGGGATRTSFSFSSSTSAGGKMHRTETVMSGGKRTTKTLRTDGETTHAEIEEEANGKIRRRKGSKRKGEASTTEGEKTLPKGEL